MALFGKKKKIEEQNGETAENKESNSVTEEMKIILEAREEEQQERQAKAEERQQAQEEASKKEIFMEEQARQAAEKILEGDTVPTGMNFFVVCDEIPLSAAPEKEGNIIVRGNIRGTVKAGSDVYLYQGRGNKYKVTIEKIRNDSREFVDELSYGRAELEITHGDLPVPENPDEDASRPVQRFAVITDAIGIEDMEDAGCRGMAIAGNPRTTAMLCEYGKYGKEPLFFATVMDCLMTSEFVTLAKISAAGSGKSTVSFMGISTKNNPGVPFMPVFTDQRLAVKAAKGGFAKQNGPFRNLMLGFAQVAAIARDPHHQGFLVNPGGPVSITIPRDLIDKMVESETFIERFGAGAADNVSISLGGTGNNDLDRLLAKQGTPAVQKMLVSNPAETPEFAAVGNAVKKYCGSRPDISRVLILITTPAENRQDKSYLCIMDCSEDSFKEECQGLAEAIKPYLRGIKKIQFQLFSRMKSVKFPEKVTWLYSKLPQ